MTSLAGLGSMIQTAERPIADILTGGFAKNRQDLVTRNPLDFRRWFPKLVIRQPW
jgi:hypothetical protein